MKLGITSYAFRYLLQDKASAPPLEKIIEATAVHGLDRLQICENAQPARLTAAAWRDLLKAAGDEGVEIQLGCKTLNLETLRVHLERVADTSSKTLRIVLEEDGEPPPLRSSLQTFLDHAVPMLGNNLRLAIENYFAVASRTLAEVVEQYKSSSVGFCIDTANSLRKFEAPEYVLKLLGPRAFCYHLKDFRVKGDNIGFSVGGATLGTGNLALDGFLDAVFVLEDSPQLFLENWVPFSGNRQADVEADSQWLEESVGNLRERLRRRGK
jgi:sugar phosphate isomerase/epimerase